MTKFTNLCTKLLATEKRVVLVTTREKIERKLEFEIITRGKWLILTVLLINMSCFIIVFTPFQFQFPPKMTVIKTVIVIATAIYDIYFAVQSIYGKNRKTHSSTFVTITGCFFYLIVLCLFISYFASLPFWSHFK